MEMGRKDCLCYIRVSTDHMEQDSSVEAQQELMQSYLRRHPEINLEDVFIERESAKSDLRPEYQRMVQRIEQGGIDYLFIKDFKRISRSSEVSADLKKLSKHYGFKFILLSTGEIYDPNSNEKRLLYGVESLINEDYVHKQSEYGRIAHKQKCDAKRLTKNNITFGYTWNEDTKTIVVHEEQAEIVREIFNMYVFKSYGVKEIKKTLFDKGYDISQQTISKYLQDESYIGKFHLNKRGSELGVGSGEKTKRFTNPKEEWVLVERPELVIVDAEIFELAQKIRENRAKYYLPDSSGKKQGRFSGTHIFASKIFCGECGYPYTFGYSDRKKVVPTYRDSHNQKVVVSKCKNTDFYRVREDDMKEITVKAINSLIVGSERVVDSLQAAIKTVVYSSLNSNSQLEDLLKKKKRLEGKAEKIKLKYLEASGALSKALEDEYNDIVDQITSIAEEVNMLQTYSENSLELQRKLDDRIDKIFTSIHSYMKIDVKDITRDLVQAVVERILINKDGRTRVILNGNHISDYQLLKSGKRGERASFSFEETPSNTYLDRLQKSLSDYVKGKRSDTQIPIFEYMVESEGKKTQKFITTVELYIEDI